MLSSTGCTDPVLRMIVPRGLAERMLKVTVNQTFTSRSTRRSNEKSLTRLRILAVGLLQIAVVAECLVDLLALGVQQTAHWQLDRVACRCAGIVQSQFVAGLAVLALLHEFCT